MLKGESEQHALLIVTAAKCAQGGAQVTAAPFLRSVYVSE